MLAILYGMNEVFELNYENIVDEKLLLSSKNLLKSGSELKVHEILCKLRW
jgi:hypothetical protein